MLKIAQLTSGRAHTSTDDSSQIPALQRATSYYSSEMLSKFTRELG